MPERARFVVGFEASTPAASVALAGLQSGLRALAWRERVGPASPLLLSDLDRMLQELGAVRGDLAAVAVTLGPGAFTGLRVGLALAKTLASALRIPLFGFSTLEMLAARWPAAGLVAPLLDARRGEVYAGLYRADNGAPIPLLPDCVAPLTRVMEEYHEFLNAEALPSDAISWLGGGAVKFRDEIAAAFPRAAPPSPALSHPSAESVALAGAAALGRGEAGLNPMAAMPVYLRASDAAIRHPAGVRLEAAR